MIRQIGHSNIDSISGTTFVKLLGMTMGMEMELDIFRLVSLSLKTFIEDIDKHYK